ncbi:MAG: flagellar hook-basal body complex protein [Proteobacteria bacterium]|nr:flagellar hook-basal body complex protein [Pseudomonadota bacterium]MCH8953253.1 flagellar hook-basal body complex protein [Pseudomonadota bacterium]
MDSSISYLALNRQIGLAREMTTIANNIANLATTGYRREGVVFAEFIQATPPGDSLSMADLRAHFASDLAGELTLTNGQFDVAIVGEGFFTIESGGETLLTRAGAFQRSAEGLLVTPDGALVLDDGAAPIFVPPTSTSLEVARDGTISVDGEPIARIGLVTAPPVTLTRVGATAFRAASGVTPVEFPDLRQGALEGSNVDPVLEIARMIAVTRAYEQAQGLLEDDDERVRSTLSRLGQAV